jgi:hypothetical protein
MGVLRRVSAITAAALGVLLVAVEVLPSCELAVPPGQFFNAEGITSIASYANAAPPTLLTGAGQYLFYAQGSSIVRLAMADGSTPETVPVTLSEPPTSIQFDGLSTIAFCAGGTLGAFNPLTLEAVALPPGLPRGCLRLAITPTRLAYTSSIDAGPDAAAMNTVVSTALLDATAPPVVTVLTADEAGVDPRRATVGVSGDTTYFVWRSVDEAVSGLFAVGYTVPSSTPGPRRLCRIADIGYPDDPKIIIFDAGGAGGGAAISILLRASNTDSVKRVDLYLSDGGSPSKLRDGGCCSGPACLVQPLQPSEQAPGLVGDFGVYGGYYYWSGNAEVHRLPIALVEPDATPPDGGPIVDIAGGAPVPSLVVADGNIFFILGSAIFRAPLPG